MFATVIYDENYKARNKIYEKQVGKAGVISVGFRVSRRRLSKVLKRYNGEVIFAENVKKCGILPFDCTDFKTNLLFSEFAEHCLQYNGCGLKIGILDPYGHRLEAELLPRLIAHAEETVIVTDKEIDELCRIWLTATGICPEITDSRSRLADCTVCFAPEGAVTAGVLYGQGGRGLDERKYAAKIPEEYRFLITRGVSPAELLCMLENEDKYCIC